MLNDYFAEMGQAANEATGHAATLFKSAAMLFCCVSAVIVLILALPIIMVCAVFDVLS